MKSYKLQVSQRHETCRIYKSFVGSNSIDHQSNHAIHQVKCGDGNVVVIPSGSWSHYMVLDSPSYTDNSKLTGPERIRLLFSLSHCPLSVSGVVSVVCWASASSPTGTIQRAAVAPQIPSS